MDATQTTDLLEETWRATIAVGHELSPQEWDRPTDCPGWSVKDHFAHIIGTERMLQDLPPAEVDPGARPYVRNPIGEFNEREIESRVSGIGCAASPPCGFSRDLPGENLRMHSKRLLVTAVLGLGVHAEGEAECPVCEAPMRLEGEQARCGGCGTTLT